MKPSSYTLLAVLIAVIAIIIFPIIRTKKSTASSGQETAQSLSSDITALKERRHTLSFLNTLFLIGVALFSAGLVVTARLSDESSDELSESQSRLDKIASDKLTEDLKEKDHQIALAKDSAARANQRAEELRKRNNELEKAIAPRQMEVFNNEVNKKLEPLRPFAKEISLIVECVPDSEAQRAASSLTGMLREFGGWKILSFTTTRGPRMQPISDGVEVDSYAVPRAELPIAGIPLEEIAARQKANLSAELKSMEAAYALIEFIQSYGWEEVQEGFAEPDPPILDGIPPNTVRIRVGFKPNSFFLPTEIQKAERAQAEARAAQRKIRLEAYRRSLSQKH